jgi:hypothetical protein
VAASPSVIGLLPGIPCQLFRLVPGIDCFDRETFCCVRLSEACLDVLIIRRLTSVRL